MNREILDRLSVITEEEQEILSGRQGIDPTRYTEKKELVIDSGKMLEPYFPASFFCSSPHRLLG